MCYSTTSELTSYSLRCRTWVHLHVEAARGSFPREQRSIEERSGDAPSGDPIRRGRPSRHVAPASTRALSPQPVHRFDGPVHRTRSRVLSFANHDPPMSYGGRTADDDDVTTTGRTCVWARSMVDGPRPTATYMCEYSTCALTWAWAQIHRALSWAI